MEDKFPTISFYCKCRKRLYTVGTNVLAIRGRVKCPRCNQNYVFLDSLIASSVASARDGSVVLLTLEAIQPISRTRHQHG